jgi:hypothetical protein
MILSACAPASSIRVVGYGEMISRRDCRRANGHDAGDHQDQLAEEQRRRIGVRQ